MVSTAKPKPQVFDYVEPDETDGEPLVLKDLTFYLPGESEAEGHQPYTAKKPKDAVWTRAGAASSNRMPLQLRVAAVLDFFESALIPADRYRFRQRFEDPEDALDVKDVVPIIKWMALEWRAELPEGNRGQRRAAGRR